jgi:hypothetical protein
MQMRRRIASEYRQLRKSSCDKMTILSDEMSSNFLEAWEKTFKQHPRTPKKISAFVCYHNLSPLAQFDN